MSFNTFDLISHSKHIELNNSELASNPMEIMIVLSSNEDKDLQASLLPKILQAVKVDINKEAVTAIKPNHNINILNQIKDLGIRKVISFGVSSKELSMNLNQQLYQILDISEVQFLFSAPLSVIANNQDHKKALWSKLQTLFPSKT